MKSIYDLVEQKVESDMSGNTGAMSYASKCLNNYAQKRKITKGSLKKKVDYQLKVFDWFELSKRVLSENFIEKYKDFIDWVGVSIHQQLSEEFIEKYGPYTNREKYLVWLSRANFYEGIGILVKRGLIDVTMVDDLISGPLMLFWEKRAGPIAMEFRERYNNPAALEWVEYLYHEVKRVRDKEHPDHIGTTAGDTQTPNR